MPGRAYKMNNLDAFPRSANMWKAKWYVILIAFAVLNFLWKPFCSLFYLFPEAVTVLDETKQHPTVCNLNVDLQITVNATEFS